MKFKIGLSLFFLAGFFFFKIMGPILVKKLKVGLLKVNQKLAEKVPWYFIFLSFFFKAFSIFCLIYIVLIWTNFITIPKN
ncbi:MAG: hypothetical protein V3U92_10975 [Cellulophaga sp.]